MKAISLWQPFATLVAVGAKRIETRSWQTPYRGLLAIHAAKNTSQLSLVREWPFNEDLLWQPLPLGVVVAVARLSACHPTISSELDDLLGLDDDDDDNHEYEYGDYSEGRYGWVLSDVRRLAVPIPLRGQQGLWELDAKTEAAITEQLELVAERS